jgi:hypothetical protein
MNKDDVNSDQKLKFSLVSEEALDAWRIRSHSCAIPNIDQLAYCLDFVPKLK